MALIYVEYITPKPGVALQDFHRVAGKQQAAWDEAFADDELLLNLARTWRIGPLPPYLCIWHQPATDLEQLDAWERIFESGSVDDIEDPINLVIRIDHAGCYRPLLPPERGRRGPYYAEFFEERDGAGAGAVTELYRERVARHDGLRAAPAGPPHRPPRTRTRATSRSGAARRTRPSGRSRKSSTVTQAPCAWSPPACTRSWGGRSSSEGGGRAAVAGEEGARDGCTRRGPRARARDGAAAGAGFSRREALRLTAGAGLLAGLPAFLAACGGSDDGGSSSSAASTAPPASWRRRRRRRRRRGAARHAGGEQRRGAGPVQRGGAGARPLRTPASSAAGGCASATSAAARTSRSTRRSARRSSTCRAT